MKMRYTSGSYRSQLHIRPLYLRQIDFNNQKTQDVDLMTGYRWFNDCHADPTLNHHWFNIPFLLGTTTVTM